MHPTTSTRPDVKFPSWSCGASWGVVVFPRADTRLASLVQQLKADFSSHFYDRLNEGMYPWGNPRRKETVRPSAVQIPASTMNELLARMNDGPDLAAAIAHLEFAAELPTGSKISWFRVSPTPLTCDDQPGLVAIMDAFEAFEEACQGLVETNEQVRRQMLAGVQIDPQLIDCYLRPGVRHFSVRRPDLHIADNSVFASESDEMPGGMPELAHLDRCYGVNQEAWQQAWAWLLTEGPVVFLVSDDWSRCYHAETRWLCDTLAAEGHKVTFLTTASGDLDRLEISGEGVCLDGRRVGTIWRQFPIWEATGRVADLVLAAHAGAVRMVPEFTHFGNKTWFSVFHSRRDYFAAQIDDATMAILDEVLPSSHLVVPGDSSFPIRVDGTQLGMYLASLDDLMDLSDEAREGLVLKTVGANPLTSRSYGVLIGHGLTAEQWQEWIAHRWAAGEPFIVQNRLPTAVLDLAVINTKHQAGELFPCRVLMRPWQIGPVLVSAHACAVPSNTSRVHGRVDMCATSVNLGV